jgi:hypothetical protein
VRLCTSQRLLGHLLVGHGLDHVGARHEHVRGALHLQTNIRVSQK